MRHRERNFRNRKRVLAIVLFMCLILITGCGGAGIQDSSDGGTGAPDAAVDGAGQQASEEPAEAGERKTEIISFGEGSEWESWTDYLYRSAKEETYAFAFIEAGSGQADFDWAYYDDRESLTDAFLQEKRLREEDIAKKVTVEAERAET
ncbi:MAG: hypothetical protein K2H40_01420, partial [Lachnospiraceae bacterium]|nr:hypothetical protein [Lachnospiraceae bacterium]